MLETRPNDIGLLLVVTQLYVLTNNHGAAITLLEAFFTRLSQSTTTQDADVRHAPGLIATLVSLYTARGQSSHARAALAKAAKYWRQRSNPPISPRALSHLYKTAGAALLHSNNDEDQALAADIFTHLHEQDAQDRYASAGLIAALSRTNPSLITPTLLSSLTPLDRLTPNTPLATLESAGIPKAPHTTPLPTKTKRSAPTNTTTTQKHKKLRASKTPKDFDPNKKMDPERWLPVKDRSSYRPKGKKAKAKQAMFMQGGVVDEELGGGSRAASPAVEAKSSGQQKKKKAKGKGGKW